MSKVPRSSMLKNFYEWRYCLRTVLLQRSQVALSNSKRSRLGLQVTRANLNARDVHTGDLYLNKDILYNFFFNVNVMNPNPIRKRKRLAFLIKEWIYVPTLGPIISK